MSNEILNHDNGLGKHDGAAAIAASQEGDSTQECAGRREFLVRAVAGAGGVVLALSTGAAALAQTRGQAPVADEPPVVVAAPVVGDELVLKLDGDSPLKAVGGSQTLDTQAGKVIVARTGDATFAACSAVCPHKGGPINYDAQQKQFFCPWHGSRFALDGAVLKPPARQPLKSFAPHSAVVVSLKPQQPAGG